MQIKRLSPAGCEELYRTALPRDFPAAECKPFAEVRRLLEAGLYEPLLLTDDAGARLAYAWQVVLPGQRTALLDYFAVRCDLRGSGVGTAALQLLRDYCWNVSILPRPPTPPLRGGASGFTCGPGRAPLRWRAACSAAGMRCFPCRAAALCPMPCSAKSCAPSTRSWCRNRIAAAGSYFTAAEHILSPKRRNGV